MADSLSFENAHRAKPAHSSLAHVAPVLAGVVTAVVVLAAGGAAFGFALSQLLGRL